LQQVIVLNGIHLWDVLVAAAGSKLVIDAARVAVTDGGNHAIAEVVGERGEDALHISAAFEEVGIQQVDVQSTVTVSPPQLGGLAMSNGGFTFTFSGAPGLSFTAWGTTNLALPLSQWSNLGPVAVASPGQYQFTDPQANQKQQRFYRVTQP